MDAADRPQSDAEELANSISHGIGLLLAAASLPLLLNVAASRGGRTEEVIGAWVFSGTMMLLYFSSAAYHALPEGPVKRAFNKLDHAAIFLFMAGTYTPFALGVLADGWGWTLLGVAWALAAAGVTLKVLNRLTHPWISTSVYLLMGWFLLMAALPLFERVSSTTVGLLVGGGATYTAGAVFFVLDSRFKFAHFIWHLFVLAGSTCHFLAAMWHAHGG